MVDKKAIKEMDGFFKTLDTLHNRHQEFHQLFGVVSDDILHYFFPKTFADMEVPGILQYDYVREKIYDSFIRDPLTDFLQESFESVENDTTRNEAWKSELEKRLGAPDLKPVVEAPSSLLTAFAKNFIQSDPEAVDLVAEVLDQMVNPKFTAAQEFSEIIKKNLYSNLNPAQQKIWIKERSKLRESIAQMIKNENPDVKPMTHDDFIHLLRSYSYKNHGCSPKIK